MYSDYYDSIAQVAGADPEVAAAMNQELQRQRDNIELIASETVSYTHLDVYKRQGMKNVGKYTVKVTLKGNYSGSKSMTYNLSLIHI